MKKYICGTLALNFGLSCLLGFSLLSTGCESTEETSDKSQEENYVSIKNLVFPRLGSSLIDSPVMTWALDFPVFDSLEVGLSTSALVSSTLNTVDWVAPEQITAHAFKGLSLSPCVNYYGFVRAKNTQGTVLDSHVTTEGFIIDNSAPTNPSSLVLSDDGDSERSPSLNWSASADDCSVVDYQVAIGETPGGTEVLEYESVLVTNHQSSLVSLQYGAEYYTSVKARDPVPRDSDVVTAGPWRLSAPDAVLSSIRTLAGTNFNSALSFIQWQSSSVNSDYFLHSIVTNPDQLQVLKEGSYKLHLTMPFAATAGCTNRCSIRARVYVNGIAVPVGVANSSYMRLASSHSESSNHLVIPLYDLKALDRIQVQTENITSQVGTITSSGIQMYVQYLHPERDIFIAVGTNTTASTNLNQATAHKMEWVSQSFNGVFSHDLVNPENITFNEAGNYMVHVNLPMETVGTCSTRQSVKVRALLDGAIVPGTQGVQGYIRCFSNHNSSSLHWSGVLPSILAGQTLSFEVVRDGGAVVVITAGGHKASLLVEKLKVTEDVLSLSGTRTVASTNWNSGSSTVRWDTDVLANDVYTHAANSDEITINESGDYMLIYSDHLSSTVARTNVKIQIQKNGVSLTGGVCKSHYIRDADGHNESSCSLVFFIDNVSATDVVRVRTSVEAAGGVVNDTSPAGLNLIKVR